MNHRTEMLSAIARSHARRHDTEDQLRSLRGMAVGAPLAELDSLLAFELQLESRLAEVLHRNLSETAA
ncbi:MAG: hypothetical protein ABSB09_12500 [Acidimicrobiales bacterium]